MVALLQSQRLHRIDARRGEHRQVYGVILKTSPPPLEVPRFDTYTLPSRPRGMPVGWKRSVVIVLRVPPGATRISARSPGRARFPREAHPAGALDHPNLCSVYEVGESEDGQPLLAMAGVLLTVLIISAVVVVI